MLIFGKSVQYLQIWGEDLSTARSSLLWSGRHPSHGSHSPQTERTQAWSHVAQSPHRVDIRPHCCIEFRAGAAWTRRGVCGCHPPKTIIWLERSNKLKVFISEVRNIILKRRKFGQPVQLGTGCIRTFCLRRESRRCGTERERSQRKIWETVKPWYQLFEENCFVVWPLTMPIT